MGKALFFFMDRGKLVYGHFKLT